MCSTQIQEVWIKRTIWKSPITIWTNDIKTQLETFCFNIHSRYNSTEIARENTTNENTYGTISRFKSTCNFYDAICDIFRRILIQIVPHKTTTFLMLMTTGRLWEQVKAFKKFVLKNLDKGIVLIMIIVKVVKMEAFSLIV